MCNLRTNILMHWRSQLKLYCTTDKVKFDIFAECAVFSQKVGRLFHPGDSRVTKEELQVSLSCGDPPWFGPRHTSKPYMGQIRDIIQGAHAGIIRSNNVLFSFLHL